MNVIAQKIELEKNLIEEVPDKDNLFIACMSLVTNWSLNRLEQVLKYTNPFETNNLSKNQNNLSKNQIEARELLNLCEESISAYKIIDFLFLDKIRYLSSITRNKPLNKEYHQALNFLLTSYDYKNTDSTNIEQINKNVHQFIKWYIENLNRIRNCFSHHKASENDYLLSFNQDIYNTFTSLINLTDYLNKDKLIESFEKNYYLNQSKAYEIKLKIFIENYRNSIFNEDIINCQTFLIFIVSLSSSKLDIVNLLNSTKGYIHTNKKPSEDKRKFTAFYSKREYNDNLFENTPEKQISFEIINYLNYKPSFIEEYKDDLSQLALTENQDGKILNEKTTSILSRLNEHYLKLYNNEKNNILTRKVDKSIEFFIRYLRLKQKDKLPKFAIARIKISQAKFKYLIKEINKLDNSSNFTNIVKSGGFIYSQNDYDEWNIFLNKLKEILNLPDDGKKKITVDNLANLVVSLEHQLKLGLKYFEHYHSVESKDIFSKVEAVYTNRENYFFKYDNINHIISKRALKDFAIHYLKNEKFQEWDMLLRPLYSLFEKKSQFALKIKRDRESIKKLFPEHKTRDKIINNKEKKINRFLRNDKTEIKIVATNYIDKLIKYYKDSLDQLEKDEELYKSGSKLISRTHLNNVCKIINLSGLSKVNSKDNLNESLSGKEQINHNELFKKKVLWSTSKFNQVYNSLRFFQNDDEQIKTFNGYLDKNTFEESEINKFSLPRNKVKRDITKHKNLFDYIVNVYYSYIDHLNSIKTDLDSNSIASDDKYIEFDLLYSLGVQNLKQYFKDLVPDLDNYISEDPLIISETIIKNHIKEQSKNDNDKLLINKIDLNQSTNSLFQLYSHVYDAYYKLVKKRYNQKKNKDQNKLADVNQKLKNLRKIHYQVMSSYKGDLISLMVHFRLTNSDSNKNIKDKAIADLYQQIISYSLNYQLSENWDIKIKSYAELNNLINLPKLFLKNISKLNSLHKGSKNTKISKESFNNWQQNNHADQSEINYLHYEYVKLRRKMIQAQNLILSIEKKLFNKLPSNINIESKEELKIVKLIDLYNNQAEKQISQIQKEEIKEIKEIRNSLAHENYKRADIKNDIQTLSKVYKSI